LLTFSTAGHIYGLDDTSMALMRNNLYAFYQQCTSLSRLFICSLYLPDPFHKSSFFYHYISPFHDLPNHVLKYFCTLSLNMTCTM